MKFGGPSRPVLAARDFRLLRDFILERAGLDFEESSMRAFERRLGDRIVELGMESFYDYYKYLRFDVQAESEFEYALERITTAETYLFRQEYQLRAFRDEVLPALHRAHNASRRLVLWSAGCSTGEEVYTLAIILAESGLFQDWSVRVIGSDLSRERVASARRGVFRETSFRTASWLKGRYFTEAADGWHATPEIKSMCHFGQLNLSEPGAMVAVGRVDAVFCRNVLIYFGQKARAQVIEGLYQRLKPGGYLFLGHSESLLNVTTAFELVHLTEDLVYRKPLTVNTHSYPRT
ncbi:MAG: hypothetical protein RJA70_851 [Pseudomonadota bacterium]|jgi:chemotaxis protein methyltransferase CheR